MQKSITHISLPEGADQHHRPSFYLAMEEFVANELRELDECFFLWQVAPTVFFGRNQLIDSEVNVQFCREHVIDMIRRKSGGGCVYADMSNVMFSYINTGWDVKATFSHYLHRTIDMLCSLGVKAYASERNDVMIDGRKVSGYAFYHIPGRNIVHGTMLYDTDMQNMVSAITPSNQKLVSKGVESVRQHICLLKDYIGDRMDVNSFKQFAISHICNNEHKLTDADIIKIKDIQRGYHDEAYIYGHNPRCTLERNVRIDGVGEFKALLELSSGSIVQDINLMGDFFLIGDLNELLSKFVKVEYQREAMLRALGDSRPDDYIMGLTRENLINVLID